MLPLEPAPWWVVYQTHNLGEAHIIAGRLRSEGISTQVVPYAGAAALGITIGVFGEVRLLVPTSDVARALAILKNPAELPPDRDQIIHPPDDEDID